MIPASDITTRELSAARLRLTDGVTFTPFFRRGQPMYRVATRSQATFFEVGHAEGVFVSLLDGRTTVAEAVSTMARVLGPEAIKEHEAIAISQWLLESGLATSADVASTLSHAADRASRGAASPKNHPLWFRIPLIRSERWLDRVLSAFVWTHSGPAAIAWLLVVFLGALQLLNAWPRFVPSADALWVPDGWLWTGLLWCVLKAFHEASHAIACRKYGGRVQEMGIMLILLAPVAYVDVSSSWGFASRRRRMHVAFAGVYADLLLAAIAALVWAGTDSVEWQHVLSRTVWLCTLSTLLFNLNPLVRSDGYYLLCDLCDTPNLSALSRSAVGRFAKAVLFGRDPHEAAGRRPLLPLAYGFASMLWSLVTMSAFLLGVALWFHGAGLIAALAGCLLWMAPSIGNALAVTQRTFRARPRSAWRFVSVLTLGVTAVVGLLVLTPWPGGRSAPFVVDFAHPSLVRADGPGLVRSVHAADGEIVVAGQLLLELANPELESERDAVAADLSYQEALSRIRLNDGDTAGAQVAGKEAESLRRRLEELDRQLAALTVRSPIGGRVICRNLSQLSGTWCELGQTLLTIAPDDVKEIHASIPQKDADSLRESVGKRFAVRFPMRGSTEVLLERITPKGSTDPLHPALVVPMGGPLAARHREKADPSDAGFELLEPHFCATLKLSSQVSRKVAVGETGFLRLEQSRTLYSVLSDNLRNWILLSAKFPLSAI